MDFPFATSVLLHISSAFLSCPCPLPPSFSPFTFDPLLYKRDPMRVLKKALGRSHAFFPPFFFSPSWPNPTQLFYDMIFLGKITFFLPINSPPVLSHPSFRRPSVKRFLLFRVTPPTFSFDLPPFPLQVWPECPPGKFQKNVFPPSPRLFFNFPSFGTFYSLLANFRFRDLVSFS